MADNKERLIVALNETLKKIGIQLDIRQFLDLFTNEQLNEIPEIQQVRVRVKPAARIKLREAKSRPVVRLHPLTENGSSSEEEQLTAILQGLISVQSNEIAKMIFIEKVRQKMGPNYLDARGRGNERWFSNTDLTRLANEFQVPFMAIERGSHWHLALSEPRMNIREGSFGVRVYNPMENGELFLPLNWTPEWQAHWRDHLGTIIPASAAAIELIKRHKYSLCLGSEPWSLQTLKGARKQFDSWNCGPISLFQSVLLAAVVDSEEPEFQTFRTVGLDRFEKAFGIDVLTRDEILDDAHP